MEHNVAEGALLLNKAAKMHGEGADRAKELISYGYDRFKKAKRMDMPDSPINAKNSEIDLDELQKMADLDSEPDIDMDKVEKKPKKVYQTEL